ncbi:hypothetical protein AN958_07115 [Leucoagaricus sp. SymC.cos]|nr:hypothetical protein AN958_07115 [Leucoagaricus sp. SymC.cos]
MHYCPLTITVNRIDIDIKSKVISLGCPHIILGLPWLQQHNSDIDWENGILQ